MRLCVLSLFLLGGGTSALRVPFVRRASTPEKSGSGSQFESVVVSSSTAEKKSFKQPHITQGIYDLEDRFLSAVPDVDILHQLSLAAEKLGEQLDAIDEAIQKSLNGMEKEKKNGVQVLDSSTAAPVADEAESAAGDLPVGKIVGFVEDMVDQLYFGVPAQAEGDTKMTNSDKQTPAAPAPVVVATSTETQIITSTAMEAEAAAAVAAPKAAVQAKKGPQAFEQLYKSFQTAGVEAVKAAKASQVTAVETAEEAEAAAVETSEAEAAPALTTAELVKVPLRGAYEMLREGRTTRRKFAVSRVQRSFAKVFRRKWLRS